MYVSKFFIFFLLLTPLTIHAYQPENSLKAILTSKIANFVIWQNRSSDEFIITILNSKFASSFNDSSVYKTIKNKKVIIRRINDIKDLNTTHILYIEQTSSENLKNIMNFIAGENILTVSDIRGFTQKGGIVQIYSSDQKLKLRINLQTAKKENLKIKASLLRLVDVVRSKS